MSTVTWGELKDRISRRAHKNLTRDVQNEDVEYWAKAGSELVEAEDAWPWLRTTESLTLVADQYEYAWPDRLARYDSRSFRYGGLGTYLIDFHRPERLDGELGPNWRDSAGTAGNPEYYVAFGRNFWVARKPSSAFVADNPTLHFYGWQTDLYTLTQSPTDSTSLAVPREYAESYVTAALTCGLQQEDDPDWARLREVHNQNMIKLRSVDESVSADEEARLPRFARYMEY